MGTAVRQEYIFDDIMGETTLDEYTRFINLAENREKRFMLIDGYIVAMAGNASFNHIRICGYISRKIGNYLEGNTCEVAQDANIYLFKKGIGSCKNVFQPDIMVGCEKDKMTDRGYEGTPALVVEVISKSTASHDYFVKCARYMQFGVKEYWIVDSLKNQILVYINCGEDPPDVYRYTFDDAVEFNTLEGLVIDFKNIAKNLD